MSDSAATAKEVVKLATTYRERQQALTKAQDDLAPYLAANPQQAAAVKKYQADYLAFLQSGNIAQGHPTSPLKASNDMEIDVFANALEQWKRDADSLNSTRKDIVKTVGNANAGKAILADIEAGKPPADISATVKKHTPLFELTNPPTKEEAIAAVYEVQKAGWEKAGKQGEEPTLKTVQSIYGSFASSTAILMDFATSGRTTALPTQDGVQLSKRPLEKVNLTVNEPAWLGAALLQVEKAREKAAGNDVKRPEAVLLGADGKSYSLEAKELSAYLQTAKQEKGALEPVDTWAKNNKVALNNHGKEYANGKVGGFLNLGETLYIETPQGQRRTVGNGIITEPLQGGHYGSIKGLKVGDKDDLDVYVSDKILKEIQAGKKYEGKIQVMQQMDKGKPDELKIGFTESLAEFRTIQASTWKPSTGFAKNNEGAYAELTYDQWKVLKEDIAKKPDLTLADFAKAHPEMKLELTPKEKLPYIRAVDGPKPEEVAAIKPAMNTLQKSVVEATVAGIAGSQDSISKAAAAFKAGTLDATDATAQDAVKNFINDIAAKTKTSIAADKTLAEAVSAGKTGNDLAKLRQDAITARQAALGENEKPDATAQAIDALIAKGTAAKLAAEAAERDKVVVTERQITIGSKDQGLSQAIKNQASDAVVAVKAAMKAAGMQNVTEKDALFVTAAMVASENRLEDANKAPKDVPLTFAFTKGEMDAAIAKVKAQTENGTKPAADLYKTGALNPTQIVGQMTREQQQR